MPFDPCNVASSILTAQFRAVAPSHGCDGKQVIRPCSALLKDGRQLERLVCIEEAHGIYSKTWIHPDDIAEVHESPHRLPAHLADKLYQAGESGMGYILFTMVFTGRAPTVYVLGNALVDFPELPDGIHSSDIADVVPHVGREKANTVGSHGCAKYRECYYVPAS